MAQTGRDRSVTDRVRDHRERMRSEGMRPIQLWVTDVRTAKFATAAHAQSMAVSAGEHAQDDQDFIDAISLDDG